MAGPYDTDYDAGYDSGYDTGYGSGYDAPVQPIALKLMPPEVQERVKLQRYLASGRAMSELPGQYATKQAMVEANTPEFSAGGFLRNAARDFSEMWTGLIALPALGYQIATDENVNLFSDDKGNKGVLRTIGEGIRDEYSHAYGNGISGFGRALYERPVSRLLDVLSVASLGAGAGAKAGQAMAKGGATGRVVSTLADTSRIAGRAVNVLDPLGATVAGAKWAAGTKTGAALIEAVGQAPAVRQIGKTISRSDSVMRYLGRKAEVQLYQKAAKLTEEEVAAMGPALRKGHVGYREMIDPETGAVVGRLETQVRPEFEDAYRYLESEQRTLDEVLQLTEGTTKGRGLTEETQQAGQYRHLIAATEPWLRKKKGLPDDHYRVLDADTGELRAIQRGGVKKWLDDWKPVEADWIKETMGLTDETIDVLREASPNGMIFNPVYVRDINKRFMPKDSLLSANLHNRALTIGGVKGKTPPRVRQPHLTWGGKLSSDQMVDAFTAHAITKQEWLKQNTALELAREVLKLQDSRVAPEWTEHMAKQYGPDWNLAQAARRGDLPLDQLDDFQRALMTTAGDVESGSAFVRVPVNRGTNRGLIGLPDAYTFSKFEETNTFIRNVRQLNEKQLDALERFMRSELTDPTAAQALTERMSSIIRESGTAGMGLGEDSAFRLAVRQDIDSRAMASVGRATGLTWYLWDKANNAFSYSVLKASPRWLAGNAVGSTLFHMMDRGVMGTFKDIPTIWKAFTDPEWVDNLIEGGVMSPGMTLGLVTAAELHKRSHLGVELQNNVIAKSVQTLGDALMKNQNPILRAMRKIPDLIGNVNERVERGFRTAKQLSEFEPQVLKALKGDPRVKEYVTALTAGMEAHKALAEHLPDLFSLDGAGRQIMTTEAKKAFVEAREAAEFWTNYAHLNYTDFTPVERNVLKRVFPVSYSFARGSAILALTYPIAHPVRMWTIGRLGHALADQRESEGAELPSYLQNSIDLGTDPTTGQNIRWNLTAFNPLGQISSRLAEFDADGGAGSLLSTVVIGPEAISPMLKVALEQATGFELFRKQQFTSPGVSKFGGEKVTPPLLWHIMSQIPQAGIARDIATALQDPEGTSGTHYGTSTPFDPQLYRDRESGLIKSPRPWYHGLRSLAGFSQAYHNPEEYKAQKQREQHTKTNADFKKLGVKMGANFEREARARAQRMLMGGP